MRANGRKEIRKKELTVWLTKYRKYIYFAELNLYSICEQFNDK